MIKQVLDRKLHLYLSLRVTFVFCLSFLFPNILYAQDDINASSTVSVPTGRPAVCDVLPNYVPQDGVNYQSGVDVNGRPVRPADLNAALFDMPDVIAVPMTVDLIERARDRDEQYDGLEALGSLGELEIHYDGLVTWNGEDWTGQAYTICGHNPPNGLNSEITNTDTDVIVQDLLNRAAVPSVEAEPLPTNESKTNTKETQTEDDIISGGAYKE